VVAEYDPDAQAVHVPAPTALYVPALQRHCTLPVQECPAGHTHSTSHTLPQVLDGSTSLRMFVGVLHSVVTSVFVTGSPSPLGLPLAHSPPAMREDTKTPSHQAIKPSPFLHLTLVGYAWSL
jgi:hypothetical protein